MRISLFLLAAAMATPAAAQQAAQPTEVYEKVSNARLFEEAFGGTEGLTRIMDDFMVNLLADPRTRPFFETVDQARVKAQLVQQFCDILQGGCVYQGATMKQSHQGMGVNSAHFYALVESLQKAMNKNDVPFGAQNRLLAVLAPMHRDIIEK
jgi:hemoglobin